jgi:broad specificity phosphatase PhoE
MHRIVYLARHGETDWNRAGRWQGHTDIALCDAGREQARALAERLRERAVLAVHASDLLRARETATIVAGALGLPDVHVDPGLRERGFGCFEGLTREECAAKYPDAWQRYRADPRQTPPGAEAQDLVVARMKEAVQRAVVRAPENGAVLLVSHGACMRALISSITGTPVPPMANTAVFRVHVVDDALVDAEHLDR